MIGLCWVKKLIFEKISDVVKYKLYEKNAETKDFLNVSLDYLFSIVLKTKYCWIYFVIYFMDLIFSKTYVLLQTPIYFDIITDESGTKGFFSL